MSLSINVHVHASCEFSTELVRWISENVPEEMSVNIVPVTGDGDAEYVPCVKGHAIGLKQCCHYIRTFVNTEAT